jgi:hypothetical protein
MAQVQLTTETKNFQFSQYTAGNSTTARLYQSARPTSTGTTGGAGARLVIGCGTNYSKLKILTNAANALQVTIYGWSFCPDLNGYVAQLLFQTATVANGGTTITGNLGSVAPKLPSANYEVSSYVRLAGDAKIYNAGTTTDAGAFLMVDTVGCEMIEIQAVPTTGSPIITVLSSSC